MKKCILAFFLVAAVVMASGQTNINSWQSLSGAPGELPEVTVLESDQTHMVVEISIPGFWLYEYPAGGRVWDCLGLPGCYSQGEVGFPDLPSVPRLFALPYNTTGTVSIIDVNSTNYENMEILPRQTPEIDSDHLPFPFTMDEQFYMNDEFYPAAWAYVDNEGGWAGLNVARLVVNPFRYNPSTGNLDAVNSITVRVDFEGIPGELANPVNPSMIPMMKKNIINWDVFENAAVPLGGMRDDGVEYVFVCNADNVDYVSDLFETHHYLGLHSRVEILPNPATVAQIKTAISDNYVVGVTRFACIVGPHNQMPSYQYSGFVGDFYYTLMDAGNYPDISVGRLTGNTSQIEHQVTKIIDGYINYGFDDSKTTDVTPSETVLGAHEQDYPYKYTLCCNQIANYAYSLCDMTFTRVYPPEGGTSADVSDAINNEIGTVGYRGHGSTTSWTWSAGWNGGHIYALTNTYMPPVFNIACDNGNYSSGTTCLCEAWQWADNGASGNLGATTSSYTTPNHDYMKQIYIALYDTGTFRIGEAINAATNYILMHHGGSGLTNAQCYIWFGDPAMDTWTFDTFDEPGALEISAPSNILPGNQDVTITVTDDGSPVENANVTITDGVDNYGAVMTVYEEGTTNSSGEVTINITAPSSGVIHIGAFLHNYNYDIMWITIGTGIEESSGGISVFSFNRISPNPITTGASLGFSVPSSGRVDLDVYDLSGRMVETILGGTVDSGAHSIEWTPSSSIVSGVYFIRLTTEGGTITRQAMVIR